LSAAAQLCDLRLVLDEYLPELARLLLVQLQSVTNSVALAAAVVSPRRSPE